MLKEITNPELIKIYGLEIEHIISMIAAAETTINIESAECSQLSKLACDLLTNFSEMVLTDCAIALGVDSAIGNFLVQDESQLGENGTSLAIPDLLTLDRDFSEDLEGLQREGLDINELLDANDD